MVNLRAAPDPHSPMLPAMIPPHFGIGIGIAIGIGIGIGIAVAIAIPACR